MNAEEMFAISRGRRGKGTDITVSLPNRVWRALLRVSCPEFNYVDRETKEVHPESIRRDVLNGRIWEHRFIGEKTVHSLCEWLATLPEPEG